MFKIKHPKKIKYPPLNLGMAPPRPRIQIQQPFRPQEVRMSAEGNGKLAQEEPKKVIAVNVEIPESFTPAFAISLLIDTKGHIVMDADLAQLDLVLHLIQAGFNTSVMEARRRLLLAEQAKSPIINPGGFRV
jgi:hypothetical protein